MLKKKRVLTGIIAAIISAGLLLSGCAGSKETLKTGDGGEPYKIGAVIDVSGSSHHRRAEKTPADAGSCHGWRINATCWN